MSGTTVRRVEEKKVPEIALGDGQQAKVYVPAGLTPEQWLKIREKTVLAGQLFKEHQFFLALNVVTEIPHDQLMYDYQLILIGLWCYLNLGLYTKAEKYCERILKTKDISGLRRGLLMALHMQGKYEDALSYTTLLSPDEQTEMAKLVQEVQATFKNKIYPPYICAIGGHTLRLEEFLHHGGNPNEIYQAPRLGPGTPSLLYLAAANGQDEVVRLLLGLPIHNASLTSAITPTTTTTTTTATPTTATKPSTTATDPIDSKGDGDKEKNIADVEIENVGWSPLHIASYLGFTNVVASLVQAKADVHKKMYGTGSDALQLALIANNAPTARLLLAHKAKLNSPMPITPNLGIVENFILVPGTTTIRVDALQGPAYWHVAAKGRTDLLKQLITDKHIPIDIKNPLNRHASLLHFVTGRGITGERCDFNTAKMLLEMNANPNALTESGYSPLHFACRCSDTNTLPTVKELIRSGADVNAMTRFNETPLVCALSADNVPVVRALIEADCNVKQSEDQLKQPLLVWCVLSGTNFLVKAVLEAYWTKFSRQLGIPADTEAAKKQSDEKSALFPTTKTPEDLQKSLPKLSTEELSKRTQQRKALMGPIVDARANKLGMSAIHWSCLKGDWVNVGLLLRFGADPKLECEYEGVKVTPLKCCEMYTVGKKFGTEPEDMADCAAIIKRTVDILEGKTPEKEEQVEIEIKDDIQDNVNLDELLKKQQQQRQAEQEKINNTGQADDEYDEDMLDGEGEFEGEAELFWDQDGEEWMEQYEYELPRQK